MNAITNGVVSDESSIMPICAPVTVNNKQAPPKAMVKPQVLTHVIEGFVIQEGRILPLRDLSTQLYYLYFSVKVFLSILCKDMNKDKCYLFFIASEPFAVSQETANILNRNNTATERDTQDEPPNKQIIF